MALSGYLIWEIEPGSGSNNNGGGFDPSQTAGMLTDGAATSATGTAPVFTSASYNFGSGDVGAWVYIASGTNWIPGWYKIASVASNAATLTATAGTAVLATTNSLSTVAGCATTASPTAATWTIDYSQQASAQFTYTDLVIAATNTNLTSVAFPFGKQQVGNTIQITSGTGFTASWYTIKSVSVVTATMDRAVGTAASTGGHGGQGGAMADLTDFTGASPVAGAGHLVWIKASGTITITSALSFQTNGGGFSRTVFAGYGTTRSDGSQVTITTSTNSTDGLAIKANYLEFRWINLTCTAGTPGYGVHALSANCAQLTLKECTVSGWAIGINGNNSGSTFIFQALFLLDCTVKSCTGVGIDNEGTTTMYGCWIKGNTSHGYNLSQAGSLFAYGSVFGTNGGCGVNDSAALAQHLLSLVNCVLYDNTSDGVKLNQGANTQGMVSINCIYYDNGGYGINAPSVEAVQCPWDPEIQKNNAFYLNTSGARNSGSPAAASDVTLTGNPFTNAASGDFSLNSTAGAGAACTGAGWQSSII